MRMVMCLLIVALHQEKEERKEASRKGRERDLNKQAHTWKFYI